MWALPYLKLSNNISSIISKTLNIGMPLTLSANGMVKEAIGSFKIPMRGRTGVIYVPADLVIDSTFPFKKGDSVKIRIDGERLIIEVAK